MPKTTRCGQQKDGAFEEELAKRMEKSGRNKGRYAARCHLTAFDWGETFAFGNPLFASIKARME